MILQNNEETFGNNVIEITPEAKSDLDELIKKTVRKIKKSFFIIVFFNEKFQFNQNLDFGSDVSSTESLDSGSDDFMFEGQDKDEIFKDCEEDDELSDDELFEKEFTLHKRDYYINKLKYPEMTE